MKVRFSPRARQDLRSAVAYLAAKNPSAATELKDQLLSMIERLARAEFQGPEVHLRSGAVVRSWPVASFRIYYQRSAEVLRVIRVYHQARRPISKK